MLSKVNCIDMLRCYLVYHVSCIGGVCNLLNLVSATLKALLGSTTIFFIDGNVFFLGAT